jgi:hypothetical protein
MIYVVRNRYKGKPKRCDWGKRGEGSGMKYARSKGKIFVCFLDSVFSCKKKKKEAAIYDTLRNERKMTDRRSRRGRGG